MDAELDAADLALDHWMEMQRIADLASSKHKHQTAAQVGILAGEQGITKAKEIVYGTDEWLSRQMFCDKAAIEAQGAKMKFEQAVRRWETARSTYAAGRRVA